METSPTLAIYYLVHAVRRVTHIAVKGFLPDTRGVHMAGIKIWLDVGRLLPPFDYYQGSLPFLPPRPK